MANPDCAKIKAAEKKEYHYESILETYKRFSHTKEVPILIKEGIGKGINIPQSHGREHIHVKRWMEAINSVSEKEQLAFQYKAIISTASTVCNKPYIKNYFAGQDYSDESEFDSIEKITEEGLILFKSIFGFKSLTFTVQGGFWGDHILKILAKNGVLLASGQQASPDLKGLHTTINKIWVQNSACNQMYYRRNILFEPSYNQNLDWESKAMADIEIAFRWGKPAVFSTHRANYIGSIFEDNKEQSLQKLSNLLLRIKKNGKEYSL